LEGGRDENQGRKGLKNFQVRISVKMAESERAEKWQSPKRAEKFLSPKGLKNFQVRISVKMAESERAEKWQSPKERKNGRVRKG